MDFLIGICSTIVGEIAKVTVAPIGRQLGYLFYYQRNIDNLRKQVEDLKDTTTSIDHQVEHAKRRGEEAEEYVKKWQNEVEKSCKEAYEFLKDKGHHNTKCSCSGSLLSRHQLSRKSKKMAETIASEIQKVNSFQNIFYRRPFKSSFENRDFEEFDTRTLTFKEIMEALEDPNCRRIGVYGIGGVGKTTLVTEVAHKAQRKGLFSEVVMVTVSQTYEIINIQKEIAEKLNLELHEQSVSAIATRLQEQLKAGPEKTLLILDDVWETINLKDVGICSKEDQRGFKILFVSRNRIVLGDVNVDKDIEVRVLSKEEARKLFNKYVGLKSEEHNLNELATKIVGHCGGLPIAIVTIACALKNRDIHAWRDTLKKLERSPRDGFGKAYSSIKTSYDVLESNQERMILLLCSLHEEDASIDVDNLTSIYAAWCNMFMDVGALEEARDSLYTSVDNLKGCCLLLNGDKDGTVKLHDVVRQIMLSIALEDKGMYCFENFTSLKNCVNQRKLNDSTTISLVCRDFDHLPNDLACPKLKLFLMHQHRHHLFSSRRILVSEGFLEEAKELRALCLLSVIVKPLSLSPRSLQNLQTLSLQNCILEDIAFIGELGNLVILDLSHSKFTQLPEQIGKLICLHQLNLNGCTDLKVIQPNVISSLVKLEELYMDGVYIKWGMKLDNGDGWNASLAELMELSKLTALHLYISDASTLLKDKLFDNEKLKRYNIVVGSHIDYKLRRTSSRLLHLKLKEESQLYGHGFRGLMKEAEELYLSSLPGVNDIVYQLDANGFPHLKKLNIEENDEVQYIVQSTGEIEPFSVFKILETLELQSLPNLERICYGRFTPDSFCKLRSISVKGCHKLKNMLPYTVARMLERITVQNCTMMKEIVNCESEDQAANNDKIEFSCLRFLTLQRLPNLIQFFSNELEIANFHGVPLFNEKVAFPSLEVLELESMGLSELLPNGLPPTSLMQNLTRLHVKRCKNLKYLFPFAIVGSLTQLEHLEVFDCSVMEEIIKEGTQSLRMILFPKLLSLKLQGLQNLKKFCAGDHDIECESLLDIGIYDCPQLEAFTCKTIEQTLFKEKVTSFPRLEKLEVIRSCESLKNLLFYEMALQLESLKVDSCLNMEEVVVVKEADEGRSLNDISFPKLKNLELSRLWMLKRFSSADCIQYFPSLLKLNIDDGSFFLEKEVVFDVFSNMIFRNLQELKIEGQNLSYLLPFATAQSLQQLKKLQVWHCKEMEHVISKGIGENGRLKKISFPKLESLELIYLPKLERFLEEADYIIECPSLSVLKIKGCGKLRTFISNSESTSTLREDEQEVEVRELATQQTLFNEKVVFSNLEILSINYSGEDVNEIWPRQSSTLLFPKLKVLEFWSFQRQSGLSLFNLHRHENLESISLNGCNMEKIWQHGELGDAEDQRSMTLAHLKELDLEGISKLMYLFENPGNIQLMPQTFQTLETLFVNSCLDLKTLAMSSYFSFNNLTDVVISDCHGMISLFDSSTAKGLEQLTRMSICNCDQMTQVICTNSKDEAESDEIVFGRLKILDFHNLPSLGSFYCGNSMLEFPNLEKLIVIECPKMGSFSHGNLNSPNLNRIITKLDQWYGYSNVNWHFNNLESAKPTEELILEGDLNRSIRKLCKHKETENSRENMAISLSVGVQNRPKKRKFKRTPKNTPTAS